MRLFIIRHGESESNVNWGAVRKPSDLNAPLTQRGLQQSELLADWIRNNISGIDLIFSSNLRRAEQTIQPIAEDLGLPVHYDLRLREGGYDYPDGSAVPDDKLPLHKSTDFHLEPDQPLDPSRKDGESYTQLKARVAEFLDEIIQKHAEKTILVSTHGWTYNAFFDLIFKTDHHRQCYFMVENTAISYFEYNPGEKFGPWRAHMLAQTPHLAFSLQGHGGEPV